jgi:hypothetical protein
MRHKQLLLVKIEKLDNELTGLISLLSYSKDIREVKNKIFDLKENLTDIKSLINTEGEGWS